MDGLPMMKQIGLERFLSAGYLLVIGRVIQRRRQLCPKVGDSVFLSISG